MFPIAVAFSGSHLLFRTAEQGLAHLSGLVTLRHGANPLSWLSIHTIGAIPRFGGCKIGGDSHNKNEKAHAQNPGRFYMAKDADSFENYTGRAKIISFILKNCPKALKERVQWLNEPIKYLDNRIAMRAVPKSYAKRSTARLIEFICFYPHCLKIMNYGIPDFFALSAYLVPSIKFRFSQEKVDTMTPDKLLNEAGCSSTEWISPLNIGLLGTVWNSLTYRTVVRMYDSPTRVFTGVALVAISAATAYYAMLTMPAFIVAHQTAILAGAILAII